MEFTTTTHGAQAFVHADSGEGPLVLLYHGFPDLPTGWAETQRVLNEAGYRTVIPYLRGYHPDTIVPGRGYGGLEAAQDAITLLDALGAGDAVIVGHDWGASVAYRAAELAPERVRAIVPVAIPHLSLLKPSPRLLWKARHFIALGLPSRRRVARRDDFAYIDTLMRRWAPNWSGADRDATLREVKAAFADERVLDGALSYYRDRTVKGIGDLGQPALIVGGTTDISPPELFRASPDHFTGPAEALILDGAGHWPHRERADAFHARLLGFLAGLDQRG